mmetsp:Transcript_1171/g.3650  ORF Transcript_1171/g.3650 Transcript_1171/m.3650 type:complete len:352 (-) Transcript_1171:335-1390(-)
MEKGEKAERAEKGENSSATLPVQRVKNIIRSNDRVAALSNDAAFLMTKATETFIGWVTSKAFALREARDKRRVLEYNDFPHCVSEYPDQLEFCTDLLPEKKQKWQHLGMDPPANLPEETQAPPAKKRTSTGAKPSPKTKADKSGHEPKEPKEPKPKKASTSKSSGGQHKVKGSPQVPHAQGQYFVPQAPGGLPLTQVMGAQFAGNSSYMEVKGQPGMLDSHVRAGGGFELSSFQAAQLPGFSLHNHGAVQEQMARMMPQADVSSSFSNGSAHALPHVAGGMQVPAFALQQGAASFPGMKVPPVGTQQDGQARSLLMPELPPLQQLESLRQLQGLQRMHEQQAAGDGQQQHM